MSFLFSCCRKGTRKEEINPLDDYLIDLKRIRMGDEIGQGEYGKVFKAILVTGYTYQTVAVKTLKDQGDLKRRELLLQEARTLHQYHHENIVNLIGVVCQKEAVMIILEYAGGGSLFKYLREKGPSSSFTQRYRFAAECADGMAYLESMNCIHRDIAARNVLLTEELLTCKIADFGLSVKSNILFDLTNEKVPIKYLSPEVLKHQQYSIKSDVWAFGILLYEIFTDAAEPYPGMTKQEVKARLTDATRFRMKIPLGVPPQLEKLMASCWEEDPTKRPTFKTLRTKLLGMYTSLTSKSQIALL